MFKFLKDRKKKDNKGFTLVELVVVVAILAILVGLLAPQYTRYVEKSRKSADVTNMDELVRAVQVYAVDAASDSADASVASATIQLTKDGVKGATSTTEGQSATTADIPDDSYLGKAFGASVPDWKKIVRKSSQWGSGDENPTIVLTVTKEGDVTVTSKTPTDFEGYFGNQTKSTD